MDFLPATPVSGSEAYAPFQLSEERLRAVAPAEALLADPDARQARGVRGFRDVKFWGAFACYAASLPLFFAGGLSWESFQILMPFLIAFIVVATVAWDFRVIGDPNRPACLVLHSLFLVSLVFLLNRLLSVESAAAAAPDADPGILSSMYDWGAGLVEAVPLIGGVTGYIGFLAEFLLKWAGYAVILFFISGAVIFPQRVATALLFVFGLIFIAVSVGQNLNSSLWSLGAGLLLAVIAFVVQLADDGAARFWARVSGRLRRGPPLPSVNMDIKLALLRLLHEEKAVGRDRFRGVVASFLNTRSDDPALNQVCVCLADQLSTQDGLAESRDGSGGWRFVLAGEDAPADFFAYTARVVRVGLTLGFSLLYILSPIDLVPDATPVAGVADDLVLGTVALLSSLRTVMLGRK